MMFRAVKMQAVCIWMLYSGSMCIVSSQTTSQPLQPPNTIPEMIEILSCPIGHAMTETDEVPLSLPVVLRYSVSVNKDA